VQAIGLNKSFLFLFNFLNCVEKNQYWQSFPSWRQKIFKLCTHTGWDVAIISIICANVIIMALEHYQMTKVCIICVLFCTDYIRLHMTLKLRLL